MSKKVLWIRHCEACHNNLSLSQKLFTKRLLKEPLCKVKAVKEAERIGKVISKYNLNINNVIYCSFLPRAIETAIFIAYGINKYFGKRVIKKVQVISYVSEYTSILDHISRKFLKYKATMCTTTVESSTDKISKLLKKYKHLSFLPKVVFNNSKCNKLPKVKNPLNKNCNDCNKVCKSGKLRKDYVKFKEEILPHLSNKVNLIVSHGVYIKKNVIKKMFNNLDHILVEYNKIDGEYTQNLLKIKGEVLKKSKSNKKSKKTKSIRKKSKKLNLSL